MRTGEELLVLGGVPAGGASRGEDHCDCFDKGLKKKDTPLLSREVIHKLGLSS